MKKLTIFAMTQKGYAVVTSIHSAHPEIVDAVVSARDRGIDDDYYERIAEFCVANGIPFRDRTESTPPRTEYAIAVSWRWLVRDGPPRLIVFHDSLLPRYRGFNPLVTALINGDTEVGVTALYASEEYDGGDIISRSVSAISYPIRIADAISTVSANYRELAARIAGQLARGIDPAASPQSDADASYSLWRDEEDYYIDWTGSAASIRRTIDALGSPYKGAASVVDGRTLRVLRAEALDEIPIANRVCGKVIFMRDRYPVVVCGEGLLRIDELVDEAGKSALPLVRFRTRFRGHA